MEKDEKYIRKTIKRDKKAQMQLSFGMIFSIILIIIFLALAFYAIKYVLSTQDLIKIRTSINDMQEDTNEIYRSSGGNYETSNEYDFPGSIKEICFIDYHCGGGSCLRGSGDSDIYDEMELYYDNKKNLFFYPEGSSEGVNSAEIKNIDIKKITETDNPYCIENEKGVEIYLKKVQGNPLIIIERT